MGSWKNGWIEVSRQQKSRKQVSGFSVISQILAVLKYSIEISRLHGLSVTPNFDTFSQGKVTISKFLK